MLDLFSSRTKKRGVQSFVLNLINNSCSEVEAAMEGKRVDRRTNLTIPILVVPMEKGKPAIGQAFVTTSKEFSATGLGIVLEEPIGLDEVVLGFRSAGEMVFVRATAKHLNPMGGGFHQLGLEMTEVLVLGDWPQLQSFHI